MEETLATDTGRLVWKDNERGLHVSLEVLDDTYSATGVTVESALEVLVMELAETLERVMLERGAAEPTT
jgi:hypothetical protein